MGFYGNITNTAKTQFQFDLVYPSRHKMVQQCPRDGVYIGRYVLVDYDSDPNNVIKDGFRKGKLSDFKDGDFLYGNKNTEKSSRITYFADEYKNYDYHSTSVINGVLEGTVVRVKETETQTFTDSKGNKHEVLAGEYSFYECIGKYTEITEVLNPTTGKTDKVKTNYAIFNNITQNKNNNISQDNYSKNYNEDKEVYATQGESIGRGWDSTVWQKVYENGEEKYVMIAELNSVVPTFDIQADAPSMSPLTPHFDEGSTNIYYKLHWQPQWGLRTRAAAGDLKTPQYDKNGSIIKTKKPIFTSSNINSTTAPGETYPSDSKTKWEKYEYDTQSDTQKKYLYNVVDQTWDSVGVDSNEDDSKYSIDAAIFWNDDGFKSDKISNTKTTKKEVKNSEWDGTTDFISIKPTGWSGHQYSSHDGFKEMKPKVDTQEMTVMLPSIGNAISDVWDIVYGGLDTDKTISKTKKRNKNINWENPQKSIGRKGLRLINDRYLPISEGEMINGYQPYIYYKWNENINDYELITDKEMPSGITIFTRSGAGQTYDPKQVATVAGAINSVHDLMGMIIVDQDIKDDPNNPKFETISSDRIYYYPVDGTYRIKDFNYEYTPLSENTYFTYQSAKDYYIKLYNIPTKEQASFKLTEKEYSPDLFYIKNASGKYVKVSKEDVFSENTDYYIKKLNVNESSIFQKVKLDTFISGWYKSSTGSYIYKNGGTVDEGTAYYDIDEYKLTDHKYEKVTDVTSSNFKNKVKEGLFKKVNNNYIKLKSTDTYSSSITYYKEDADYKNYWPHIFLTGHNYEKNIFYYKTDKVYNLMDTDVCDRNKTPFYKIPQEMGSNFYPYIYSLDNIENYDVELMEEPEDPEQAEDWTGPYLPEGGYWDTASKKWITNKRIYPTYFFVGGVSGRDGAIFYRKQNSSDGNKYDVIFEGEKYLELNVGIPSDGYAYIFDRPRANSNVPGEAPVHGNPKKVFKVKLINFQDLKNQPLYYMEEFEEYDKLILDKNGNNVKDENGNNKTEKAIRAIKWSPVTEELLSKWYKNLGLRDTDEEELDVFKPEKQIYYLKVGNSVKNLYEPNRYFYKVTSENKEPSYIKDTNLKFTANTEYFDSNYFIQGDNPDIHAIVPLGDSGEYYMPNKYYYFDESRQQYVIDTSLTPRNNTQYYRRNNIYISEDTSGFFQKGASWNMNAEAIPHSVTLGSRQEINYMKELKSFGRNYNTINGLILELNKLIASDKPDTRDRSTLQGAINYLNDIAIKIHDLTPGDLPVVDSYGRLHGGIVETDKWIDVKIDPNVEQPRMIVTHEASCPAGSYGLAQNETSEGEDTNKGTLEGDRTFEVPYFTIDKAGHVTKAATNTVQLPKLFNKVLVGDESTSVSNITHQKGSFSAEKLNDTINIASGNKWIHLAASDKDHIDKIAIAHEVNDFDNGKANDEYGLLTDKTIKDGDNSFEIPAFKFDEAGHIRGARTHTLTLPYGFTKFTKAAHTTTTNTDKTSGSLSVTIEPDTTTDTLTIKNGNNWICIDGNDKNNTFTFSHYVNGFTEGASTTNLNDNGTFTVQELGWDRAGHLIASNKRTYTLPNNFKTFTVSNDDGKDSVDSATAINGSLIAGNQIDEMTFASGNRWMTLIADANNKKVTLAHAKAGTAFVSKGDTTNQTPNFGSTFKVLSAGIDQTGHVSGLEEHTVQIPKPSLSDSEGGTASVLTNLSLTDTTGAFATKHKNVGELLITGYLVATKNGAISATDTINGAFGKVQKALDTLNANSETAGSVAKSVKDLKDELQDNCSEKFNTLAKIEKDINDGSETTLVKRVQDLEKRALPHYDNLENEGMYIMKMIDGQPNWIKLATWTGGTY